MTDLYWSGPQSGPDTIVSAPRAGHSGRDPRGRTSAHAVRALAIASALLVGCSSTGPSGVDASAPRDGTVVDSTISNADAASDAGAAADAALGDAGGPSCGGSCDPRATSACGAAMVCRFASGGPACTASATADAGLAGVGSPCASESDCAAGSTCFADGVSGVCGRACCATRSDCEATERCRGDGLLIDGSATAWGECLPPLGCDLAHPHCGAREGCYIVDGGGTTECLIAGSVASGGSCDGVADCAPGFVCTGLTTQTCVAICWLASTEPHQGCAATEHCVAQAYSPAGTGICTAP